MIRSLLLGLAAALFYRPKGPTMKPVAYVWGILKTIILIAVKPTSNSRRGHVSREDAARAVVTTAAASLTVDTSGLARAVALALAAFGVPVDPGTVTLIFSVVYGLYQIGMLAWNHFHPSPAPRPNNLGKAPLALAALLLLPAAAAADCPNGKCPPPARPVAAPKYALPAPGPKVGAPAPKYGPLPAPTPRGPIARLFGRRAR